MLGLPLSLAWVVGWVIASFLGLLALYRWEASREARGDRAGEETGDASPEGGTGPVGSSEGEVG